MSREDYRSYDEEEGTIELIYDSIKTQREKATLFIFGDVEQWIPGSLIDQLDVDKKIVTVMGWFVEQEGLECFEND